MAVTLSRHAGHRAAGTHRQPTRTAQPDRADWARLPTAHKLILRLLHRNHEMMPLADLRRILDLPDIDSHLDDLRRYVQRVWIPGEQRTSEPNGVALTVAGADLVRWGAKHVVR